jgi:hypothetical protein
MLKKFLALVVCLACMVGLAVPVSAGQGFVTFGAETINLNVDVNHSGKYYYLHRKCKWEYGCWNERNTKFVQK